MKKRPKDEGGGGKRRGGGGANPEGGRPSTCNDRYSTATSLRNVLVRFCYAWFDERVELLLIEKAETVHMIIFSIAYNGR